MRECRFLTLCEYNQFSATGIALMMMVIMIVVLTVRFMKLVQLFWLCLLVVGSFLLLHLLPCGWQILLKGRCIPTRCECFASASKHHCSWATISPLISGTCPNKFRASSMDTIYSWEARWEFVSIGCTFAGILYNSFAIPWYPEGPYGPRF